MSLLRIFLSICLLALPAVIPSASANITTQTARVGPYTASPLPATLSVTFPFQSSADLLVLDMGSAGTSAPVVLTLNSDYTVTGGGYNSTNNMQTGSVVVVTGGANNVQAGDRIMILRNVPVNQLTYFPAGGILTGAMIEKALDKQATISQQLTEAVSRTLRFPAGETADGTMVRASRTSKYLGFDSTGALAYLDGSSGGGGTTYTAGTGLLLVSNQFSVNPVQTLTTLTVSGVLSGTLTGNATTASVLATARTINGISFDGSANITVPAAAVTLTGTTLATNVTTSSLLSVAAGTIGSMVLQNSNAVSITGGTVTGAVVTGLGAPSGSTDAANKAYVDSVAAGITPRTGVVVATTANITLSAPQTIDGTAVIATNRVLVKNQTAPAENGIYDVAAGAWVRSTDSNTAAELLFGYYYFVTSGTTQGATSWFIQTAPVTLGVSPVVFSQFSASQNYTAGTGLGLAGNVFSLNSSLSGLTITASAFNGTIGATTPSTILGTTQTISGNSYLANLVIKSSQLNETATNATASLLLNYDGYGGGTTQFRNLDIYDGKNALVATFVGSTKAVGFVGGISATTGAFSGQITQTMASPRVSTVDTASANKTWDWLNTGGNFYLVEVGVANRLTVTAGVGLGVTGTLSATGAFSNTTDAVKRTTKGNFHLTVNVKDYGATGDGVTNDTTAINAAIAALTNYSTLLFPAGNYLVTAGSITGLTGVSYVRIYGEGARLYSSATGATGNFLVVDETCSHIDIDNLGFVGSATIRGNGIGVRLYSDYSSITNCYFTGMSDFAIHVSNGAGGYNDGTRIENNTIVAPLGDGIHVGAAVDFVLVGNVIRDTGDDGIGIIADSASFIPSRGVIVGNHIYNAQSDGIRLNEADDMLVEANDIRTSVAAGIEVNRYLSTTAYNDRVHIKGNKVYNAVTTLGPRGAIWMNFCTESSVTDNEVHDISNGAGIALLDFNDLVIKGNTLRNIAFRGIVTDDSTTTNVATTWYNLTLADNNLQYVVANEGLYVVPASGITLSGLIVTGNNGMQLPTGNWIYYDRITTGKVGNNTSRDGKTVAAGGTVTSVTAFNNN